MKKVLLTACLVFGSAYSQASTEVDCTYDVVKKAVYGGWSDCRTHNGSLIEQFVQPSSQQVVLITGYDNNNVLSSCFANVDFWGYENVSVKQCKYKPELQIRMFRMEDSTETKVWIEGSDQDGHITKAELWVNGVKRNSNNTSLRGPAGTEFEVRAKVTDNDGYTASTMRTISLVYRPNNPCDVDPRRCR
ncbi:hypothetical protein ABMY35_17960 [Pseudoalteromonas sp. BZB3]|uniref:hypothetical protein n=1 Tax=Pseudoalteromonas sp. BZB3 TaxID=3136670 RepID=UPI0032C42ADD